MGNKIISIKNVSIAVSIVGILLISFWYYEPIKAALTKPASSPSVENLPVNQNSKISEAGWKNYIKPADSQLRTILTPLQYEVTQQQGTEKPFTGKFEKNKSEGIYVDVVSGEPLFSSNDKYESGTGWPAFTKPINPEVLTYIEDKTLFLTRIEVRSKYADSHLGHVFEDGPIDKGGKRYCINSAALRFVPKANMQKEGYGSFL